MKKRIRVGLLVCFALVIGVVGFVAWHFFGPVPQATGALPDSVYIWQYRWTEGVVGAVHSADQDVTIQQLLVVSAEIMPGGGNPKIRPVLPDYALLATLQKPIALVIRIGAHGGPFNRENSMSQAVARAVRDSLGSAQKAGWTPAEIQLDFDCPTRCLSEYAQWITQAKEIAGTIPVSITALPAWLDSVGFRKVINIADGYVLQVHSVSPATKKGELPPLCDTVQTRRWMRQAARLGKPFRVALPTYTYRVGFDAKGRYVGVAAESVDSEPQGVVGWKMISADAAALATLVKEWQQSHPAMLTGVVWYRLPVPEDRLNWTTTAWNKVRRGELPAIRVDAQFETTDGLLQDLFLKNTGDLATSQPSAVKITWEDASLVAADAIGGYKIVAKDGSSVTFQQISSTPQMLNPGERSSFGWIRFKQAPKSLHWERDAVISAEPKGASSGEKAP
ncbi:MAG: DUF3142 domain-containing protein [Puniceicoccales bacterium]|jgi:hypothetical protein|nr:DUF3142 domain-containing protein [Puniceicoccales bacterium]